MLLTSYALLSLLCVASPTPPSTHLSHSMPFLISPSSVHVRDVADKQFATRIGNVFVTGQGNKSMISLPKGGGVKLTVSILVRLSRRETKFLTSCLYYLDLGREGSKTQGQGYRISLFFVVCGYEGGELEDCIGHACITNFIEPRELFRCSRALPQFALFYLLGLLHLLSAILEPDSK